MQEDRRPRTRGPSTRRRWSRMAGATLPHARDAIQKVAGCRAGLSAGALPVRAHRLAARSLRVGGGSAAQGASPRRPTTSARASARGDATCARARPAQALETLEPALQRAPRRSESCCALRREAYLAIGTSAKGGAVLRAGQRARQGQRRGQGAARAGAARGGRDRARHSRTSRPCRSRHRCSTRRTWR